MPDYGFIAQGSDPYAKLGEMAQTMNAVNQNKLFAGQQAAGQALQQSIGPDGQVDFQKAASLVSRDPRTAPYAMEAINKLLTSRGQDITNTTGQTNLQGLYATNLRRIVSSVPPGPNQATQILSQVTKGAQMGLYPPDVAATFVGGGQLADGTTLADLAKQAAIANESASAQSAQFGDVTNIDTGGQVQPTAINRAAGSVAPIGAPIAKTLTPETKASRQTVIEGGVPTSVPTSSLVTDTGEPKPSRLTGPNGEAQAALTPAQQAAGTTAGAGSAGMALGLTQRASRVADNKGLLGNMDGLLDQFTPGPQSGFWKGLNQIATQYGLAPPGSPPANKAAAQEEFGKLAFQLAQSQFQALGGTGTDSKLDSTMHTSPSDLLTRYGNKGIIALLKGNEDAVRAQNDAWQKWKAAGHGDDTFDQFSAQWQKIFDPRVFQSQYATPQDRQAMLKGMTAQEQTKFRADFARAHKLGWVQ